MSRANRQAWTKVYWSDVFDDGPFQALSFDEQGRYWRVMGMLYRHDTPGVATEAEIRGWSCYSEAEWPAHRKALARCFQVVGNCWTQKRIVREMAGCTKRATVLAVNGRKGADVTNSRKRKKSANADSVADSVAEPVADSVAASFAEAVADPVAGEISAPRDPQRTDTPEETDPELLPVPVPMQPTETVAPRARAMPTGMASVGDVLNGLVEAGHVPRVFEPNGTVPPPPTTAGRLATQREETAPRG